MIRNEDILKEVRLNRRAYEQLGPRGALQCREVGKCLLNVSERREEATRCTRTDQEVEARVLKNCP